MEYPRSEHYGYTTIWIPRITLRRRPTFISCFFYQKIHWLNVYAKNESFSLASDRRSRMEDRNQEASEADRNRFHAQRNNHQPIFCRNSGNIRRYTLWRILHTRRNQRDSGVCQRTLYYHHPRSWSPGTHARRTGYLSRIRMHGRTLWGRYKMGNLRRCTLCR